jgi:SAM-dependent methyltransferase
MAFCRIPAYCKYELFMERYRHAAEFVSPQLAELEMPKALDVGSGPGHLKVFFDHEKTMEWHGIEVREEMVEECGALGYRMHTHNIDKGRFPFEDETFDLVACLHVLEHLKNPAEALREIARIVKCGGLLVLGVPTKPLFIAGAVQLYYRTRQLWNREYGRTCNSYSAHSFRRMLRSTLGTQYEVKDFRGFRLFSARKLLPLENQKWFYKISRWIGKTLPGITPEINVILQKNSYQQIPAGDVREVSPRS